jgi:hypothetical protein
MISNAINSRGSRRRQFMGHPPSPAVRHRVERSPGVSASDCRLFELRVVGRPALPAGAGQGVFRCGKGESYLNHRVAAATIHAATAPATRARLRRFIRCHDNPRSDHP